MKRAGSFFVYKCGRDSVYTLAGKLSLVQSAEKRFCEQLSQLSELDEPFVQYDDYKAIDKNGELTGVRIGFVCTDPHDKIVVTVTETCEQVAKTCDLLTGLYRYEEFVKALGEKSRSYDGELLVLYFDICHFKIINDMFGSETSEQLLVHIADSIRATLGNSGEGCHIDFDRFALYTEYDIETADSIINSLVERVSGFDLAFEIVCNVGAYIYEKEECSPEIAVDRAIMAQSEVKGSYTQRSCYFSESLRSSLMSEQEITGIMRNALQTKQFLVYYQPQYNHSTGALIGAEALVRWKHPEKGMICPAMFIPVFEKNGFITKLDHYIFEQVCIFLRRCIDKQLAIVPISVNLTRYDIFTPNFIEDLEQIRQKYDIPSKLIRIEITESAALGSSRFINEAVRKLHGYGYIVEMDDFGSGYSSLNILKDIDFDIIKLDMKFLEKEEGEHKRGGTILSSVVRMVNWLGLPMIAEGVETVEQADFLQSIGCYYIQGYLYSRPLPEEEYEQSISKASVGKVVKSMKLIDRMNAENFWSNDSLETLIFSNFVGAACIFDLKGEDDIEILRVNKKYLIEVGMNLSEKDMIESDPWSVMSESEKQRYLKMLRTAIETGEEQECETWRRISSECCGEENICIRSSVRMIGQSKGSYLFHAMIRNITAERNRITDIMDSERRFKAASEQANIYYWEYTVETREMRPCFRCMRDLGLPPMLTDYPDSAIEAGVFPPEVADLYRDWHRQIAQGVPYLEAVMPLTVGRIPFHVRYTTEFDENGRPVKAYGSATLVVDNDKDKDN